MSIALALFGSSALGQGVGANDRIEFALERIKNREVIDVLRKAGDDCAATRVIEHFFYGPPAAYDELKKSLLSNGQFIELQGDALRLDEESNCELDAISQKTLEFGRLARSLGMDYDGWGSAVVLPKK